jgi:hypothetical protein
MVFSFPHGDSRNKWLKALDSFSFTDKDILGAKGPKVYSVSPDATVYEALKRMAKKTVGAMKRPCGADMG